jgi:hypothetical protein
LDIPVVAIDDDFGGVADQEEVPIDHCDKDTATDDIAESGWDHALPDIVANVNIRVSFEYGQGNVEHIGNNVIQSEQYEGKYRPPNCALEECSVSLC